MTYQRVEELTAVLDSAFRESGAARSYGLFRDLIRLLAEGKPIPPQQIATSLELSPEKIATILRRLPNIEFDEYGNVIGAGLTLRPTPHRFTINGRTLFTWCALDALMFPGLLGQTVQVESPCVTTGTPVRVKVTPNGVDQIEPPEAVVSLVTPNATADIRRAFCDYVNFFSSNEAASPWLSTHPGATTLPVREAYQLGKRLAESVFENKTQSG